MHKLLCTVMHKLLVIILKIGKFHYKRILSRSLERILIWCSCGTKAEIFELSRATADSPPLLIFLGAPRPGSWTSFDSRKFSNFSVSDER